MEDVHDELLKVIHYLETQLKVMRNFGVRSLRPRPAGQNPEEVAVAGTAEPGRPVRGAGGLAPAGRYQFGDGRRARWEQAFKAREEQRERSAKQAQSSRSGQAWLFGSRGKAAEELLGGAGGATVRPEPLQPEEARARIDALRMELGDCTRCVLSRGRTQIVFGEGSPTARLVLAGEGPGQEEDRTGRPFVGRAGQLLDRILSAMDLKRQEVYICNVVKCRPPNNRTPLDDEMRTCGMFLTRQLEIIRPWTIIALGATAVKYLLGTNQPMNKLRGRFFDFPSGAKVLPTYHPAYLLRNPAAKKVVWEDVQKVMAEMAKAKEENRA